jgi:hypothetical protein
MANNRQKEPYRRDAIAEEVRRRLVQASADRDAAPPQSCPQAAAAITPGDPMAHAIASSQLDMLSDLADALTRRLAESDPQFDRAGFRQACGLEP